MTSPAHHLEDPEARTRYQSLWEQTGGVFTSLRYAEAAGEVFGLQFQVWFHGDEAALLVHQKGPRGFSRIVIPPFTQYTALLLRTPPPAHLIHRQESPLDELLKHAERGNVRANLLVPLNDPRTAQWRGWRVTPRFTYLINLPANPDEWSSGARRTWRSNISRYEILEDQQKAGQAIDLCRRSYERHGRNLPAPPEKLEAMTRKMQDWTRVFLAVRNNVPEAGIVILHDGHTAHYWIAGSIPGPAMTVLIGEVLARLSHSGISVFDFVGANTPSIAEFKRSFAPVLTQYYHLRWKPRLHL